MTDAKPTKFDGYKKYQDESGEWRWRQQDDNGKIIAESGEGYESESGVDRAVENVVGESAEAAESSEADGGDE